jgi:DNA recombination protein RmuC
MDGLVVVLIVLAIALAAVIGALVFVILRQKPSEKRDDEQDKGLAMLQREMQEMRRAMDESIRESSRDIHTSMKAQLGESARLVKEITSELVRVGEGQKQVVGFAEQLRNLQDVLQNPKQRGILGEYYLETVLQNVLPPGGYQMQYGFNNGEIVDAAVFVKERVIPIDSKFSLENYNRMLEALDPVEKERLEKAFKVDLKLRIDETSKYVRPNEGTTEFAFMFVPSEGLYYDMLVNRVGARDLIEYAFGKKVIIVSPTSFLAYLQTVLQGLKALQIEESAKEIRTRVEDLGRHIAKYDEYYKKLGSSLSTTVNHYNAGYKELGKIDKDVLRIAGASAGIETELIERPGGAGE